MGFFSDIVGGLFGGDDTEVQQQATNTTNVNVTSNLTNVIDIAALAEAVKAMGTSVQGAITATGDQTNKLFTGLLSQLNVNQQAAIIAQVADIQSRENVLKAAKTAALAGAAYIAWRQFK